MDTDAFLSMRKKPGLLPGKPNLKRNGQKRGKRWINCKTVDKRINIFCDGWIDEKA